MMYVDKPKMVYGESVELHKQCTQEQECNIDTKKLGVVECLDIYEVTCCDAYVVACLDEGVLAYLGNNSKNDFYGDFIHAHPL